MKSIEHKPVKVFFWLNKIGVSILVLSLVFEQTLAAPRGGGGKKGKGKGKNILPFKNVNEHSLVLFSQAHPRGARLKKASHFTQSYKLGYKVQLVCIAEGSPVPDIKWFKDGSELQLKPNTHIYIEKKGTNEVKSKIEIDPATVGDQGIYTCMANNEYSVMVKNFKTEYYY